MIFFVFLAKEMPPSCVTPGKLLLLNPVKLRTDLVMLWLEDCEQFSKSCIKDVFCAINYTVFSQRLIQTI